MMTTREHRRNGTTVSSPGSGVDTESIDRRGGRRGAGRRGADDRGFLLVTFGLLLIPLVAFTALAVDVSSWYSRATELQRSADAASLAGVVWMPDLGRAQADAAPVLAKNGVVNGSGNMTVTMGIGTTGVTSFRVCVTDTKVTQFFSVVFASPTQMTRCATAQYNAPLQLGSPLNYFGGNHDGLTVPGPVPADATIPPPASSAFGGYQRCWVNVSSVTVGYWDRQGSNNSSDWRFYPFPANNPGGSYPDCGTNQAPALPNPPSNGQSCSVPGAGAYWYKYSNSGGAFPAGWRYRNSSYSYPDCTYGSGVHPIPTQKSPNFWAAIESYNYGHANGDAYSNAGSEYRDTGYWYSVDAPASGVNGGTISIQAWDLTYNCNSIVGGCRTPMGDTGGNSNSTVRMRVYKAGALKYDMSTITAVSGCDTGWLTGNGANSAYDVSWRQICSVTANAGDRFYIQVQSTEGGTGLSAAGVTGYALRTVAGTFPGSCLGQMPQGNVACYGTGVQPRLSAYGDMEMYNGIDSGQPTQFFLAEVVPTYAGKTLVIDLFDPGDGASTSWVTVRGPSQTSTAGSVVPASACSVEKRRYGTTSWSGVALSNGPNSTYNSTCTVQTSGGPASSCDGGSQNNKFNDCWLRFKIDLPSDYGPSGSANWTNCDTNVADPVTTPGSCWWQISYFVGSGQLGDYTTWSARVIGDPVRLTQ